MSRRTGTALAVVAFALLGAAAPDWPAWFAKNTTVTDKKAYVHFFWNANDVRSRFQGREGEALVAEASRQLVAREYPPRATADLVKVDVVFVTQRDNYGMPKWDSLQRYAHIEASRKKLLAAPPDAAALRKAFEKFELF